MERIGIDDRFFDLGGDSLSAMVLFVEIEQAFGVQLPVRTLIDHETIRQVAALIRDPQINDLDLLVPFSTSGEGLPVFLIPGYHWRCDQFVFPGAQLEGRQPVYGLQVAGMSGEITSKQSVHEVAARYIIAIQGIQASGPYRLIGGSAGGWVAYEMAQILRDQARM